jgi:hypothetical protein
MYASLYAWKRKRLGKSGYFSVSLNVLTRAVEFGCHDLQVLH